MRRVIIIGSAHPLRGGLATYNERLAKTYQDMGDEVTILTFSLQYPKFLFPGKTQYSSEPAPKDLSIKVCINSINPFNWIRIGLKLKRKKPDLVVIKFWMPFMAPCLGTIAKIARWNKHTKVVSIIDNIIPHEKRMGDKTLAKYFTHSVDGFVVMSKSVFHDLQHFESKHPKVFCPHPLYDNFGEIINKNQAKTNINLDVNTKYLLFFGFIRDYKGLDLLLKAFADERLRRFPVKLIVAGEFYSDSKLYFDLIEQLNLKDHVIMANDFIPDSKVADYFNVADMVVQPYKDATQSGVTQIAYHFNKPMLVTDVGGLAEIVPNGKVGYVVKPDVKQIADALVHFYENNKEAEFSNFAKEEKKKYSWEKMLSSIDEVLENL